MTVLDTWPAWEFCICTEALFTVLLLPVAEAETVPVARTLIGNFPGIAAVHVDGSGIGDVVVALWPGRCIRRPAPGFPLEGRGGRRLADRWRRQKALSW